MVHVSQPWRRMEVTIRRLLQLELAYETHGVRQILFNLAIAAIA